MLDSLRDVFTAAEARSEKEFAEVLPYFQERRSVLFLSDWQFWGLHGFRPQSLARTLATHGVRVLWLDGAGWRPSARRPVVSPPQKHLSVKVRPELPGRRYHPIYATSEFLQSLYVKQQKVLLGGKSIVWVQGGISKELSHSLGPVDVFSYFDELKRVPPTDPLCRDAKVVTVLNDWAHQQIAPHRSTLRLYSPTDIPASFWKTELAPQLPKTFPTTVAGYLGSLYHNYFDYAELERMMREFPDMGFVLGGRTDPPADAIIQRLSRHSNFLFFPWVPRHQLLPIWQLIDLSLLLYRGNDLQPGSFASKALESLFFGIPCIGTRHPKTEPLAPYFPLLEGKEPLARPLHQALHTSEETMLKALAFFAYEMHPQHHLAMVARQLIG